MMGAWAWGASQPLATAVDVSPTQRAVGPHCAKMLPYVAVVPEVAARCDASVPPCLSHRLVDLQHQCPGAGLLVMEHPAALYLQP